MEYFPKWRQVFICWNACAKSCERMVDTNWLGYNFQKNCYSIENGFLDSVIYFVIDKGRRSITSEHFTMTIHQKPKILLCMKTIYFIPPKKNMRCVTKIHFFKCHLVGLLMASSWNYSWIRHKKKIKYNNIFFKIED